MNTEFQRTSAAMAIVLQIYSKEAVLATADRDVTMTGLKAIREKIGASKFWWRFGGIDVIESQLCQGFEERHAHHFDSNGTAVTRPFPTELRSLIDYLRQLPESYSQAASSLPMLENINCHARKALPILQGFVEGRYTSPEQTGDST